MARLRRVVLIIDDNPEDCLAFRRALERSTEVDYVCNQAYTAAEGLAYCRETQPDAILIDYRLPDSDGLSLLRQLIAEHGPLAFALLILTGVGSEAVAVQAMKIGAHDYLAKAQVAELELRPVLERALEKLKLQRQLAQQHRDLAALNQELARSLDEHRAHERQLQLALASAHMAPWQWDVRADVLEWSARIAELLDPQPASVEALFALIHPADRAAVRQALADALANDILYDVDFRLSQPGGREIWLSARGELVRDAQGTPFRLYGMAMDITARKQNEQRLGLFEQAAAKMQDVLMITEAEPIDLPGPRIVYVNQAFTEMTGYTAEEVVGQTPRLLQGPRTSRAELDRIRQSLRRWRPVKVELVNYRKDGTPFDVEVVIVPIADATGWYTHWVSVQRDVTERNRFAVDRERLLQQEQAARALAEQASGRLAQLHVLTTAFAAANTPADITTTLFTEALPAVGAYAGVLTILSADGQMLEVLGAHGYPSELVKDWRHFSVDAAMPVSEAARTGRAVWLGNRQVDDIARFPILRAVGPNTQAWAAIPLLVNDTRPLIGVIGLSFSAEQAFTPDERVFMLALAQACAQALDRAWLFERAERARSSAEEAVQVRDQFFSVAAHELKNPLTSLIGYAQLLERRLARGDAFGATEQRGIHVLAEQAQRLASLINSLFDASRLDLNKMQLERVELDLASLVERIVTEFRLTLPSHTVMYTSALEPILIYGDAIRLEQVIQNLLSNAGKYSPAGGIISVTVEQYGKQAVVEISDQGIGIPAQSLPSIFQRFYRDASATTSAVSGLGVGLYVVKELVALHNGEVTVRSEAGRGSTFTVLLPALNATAL